MPIGRLIFCLGLALFGACNPVWAASEATPALDAKKVAFFESRIRPVLAEQCFKCHSAQSEKLRGGLYTDSRQGLMKGGDSGPAIDLAKADESLLIKALRHDKGVDLAMPPKQPQLPESVAADFVKWIKQGALWPDKGTNLTAAAPIEAVAADVEKARREHWAFQPLHKPELPPVKDATWGKSPIDAFILAKLEQKGLKPSAPADRRTLLRRVYLDLIGLPPTPAEQQRFLDDKSAGALEAVVDDLLSRPQYGERWGRHWLDVARYAETHGYERDEPKPFAWKYRDWTIEAFNKDKPYDRFVVEQIAGDEIPNADADSQIATTFLRVGTYDTIAANDKQARYDQLDDVVGTVASAFMGQTLRCARCHNHKFEPYSQVDYYRILAVFNPMDTSKPQLSVLVGSAAQRAEFDAANDAFDKTIAPIVQTQGDLYLKVLEANGAGYYSEKAKENTKRDEKKPRIPSELLAALKKPIGQRDKGEKEVVAKAERKIADEFSKFASADEKKADEAIRKRLDLANRDRPKGMQAYAVMESGRSKPDPTYLFIRGDINRSGVEVVPGIPPLWAAKAPAPPAANPAGPEGKTSGRRLWLANWMVDGGKATVARVMANRIWQYHFGRGIVATSNDLGLHGDAPSHTELLDWLAADLVEGGWKIKRLQKEIILSSVYQQSAAYADNSEADPDNALLWHWPSRRLESEAIRDSVLAVSGKLNPEMGGPQIYPPLVQRVVGDSAQADWGQSDERQSARRSVYVFQKRSIPLPEMEILGLPDQTASCDVRSVSATALQSLWLLNSRFANEQATALAERVQKEAGEDVRAQVNKAFEIVLCRPPRPEEIDAAMTYLQAKPAVAAKGATVKLTPFASFCLVLLNTNEFAFLN